MFFLGGTAMLGGAFLQSLDEILVDVPYDQLCHVLPGHASTAINDSSRWSAFFRPGIDGDDDSAVAASAVDPQVSGPIGVT